MAITIPTALPEYNPVLNPVRYGAQGSAFDPGTIVRPSLVFYFDLGDMPLENDTITLESTVLGTIVYTFKNTPADNETELPAYTAGTTSDYATLLAPALQAKYIISANYIVIPFQAGPLFGVFIAGLNLSQDPDVEEYSPDQDLLYTPGGWAPDSDSTNNANSFELPANAALIFQLLADVDNPNGDVRSILEEEYPPDSEGIATIDVADAVRSVLRPTFPDPDNTVVTTAYDSFCAFQIRVGERYGDDVATLPMNISAYVYGYLAGRNEVNRANFPDYEDQVIGAATNIKFLTTWPNNVATQPKQITPAQIEYLAWIFPSDRGANWVLKADLYYETGADTTAHTIHTITALYNDLLLCPVGVELCGLHNVDPTRRLRAYRIYLTTNLGTLRSEYRYYTVDHRYHHHLRQFVYWTPSGGLDTILLLGAPSESADIDVQRSRRYALDPTTPVEAGDAVAVPNTTGSVLEQGTCYLREGEMPALKDLVGAIEVRMLSGDEWLPIEILDKGDIDLANAGAGIASRKIKYRIAHTGRANL